MQDLGRKDKLFGSGKKQKPASADTNAQVGFFVASPGTGAFYLNPKIFIPCVIAMLILMCAIFAHAQQIPMPAYTDAQIVNAIYRAEGDAKATFAYGIRSVPYRDITEARRICFNTVRNNRKRFTKQSKYTDFIEFLGSRYCPVSAHPLNKFWVRNVRRFLNEKI